MGLLELREVKMEMFRHIGRKSGIRTGGCRLIPALVSTVFILIVQSMPD